MFFFLRTNNPRPSFDEDMTDAERAVMQAHVAYWSEKAEQGIAIVFGPVADPAGVYGIGVYRAEDEREMRALVEADPANGLLKLEVLPMAAAVLGSDVRAD